jgi:hypothetical protein
VCASLRLPRVWPHSNPHAFCVVHDVGQSVALAIKVLGDRLQEVRQCQTSSLLAHSQVYRIFIEAEAKQARHLSFR